MNHPFNEISTGELHTLISKPDVKIIDVRPVDAYNGWQIQYEFRGGHILHAKSLPAKWINYMDWIEVVRHKNILPAHRIVIYSYQSNESVFVAERFLKSGYPNVSVYNHFIDEWSTNPELPMQQLQNYRQLVSASWVRNLISGNRPPQYDNHSYVIVHAHYRNRDAYLSGHIPGAIDMDTLAIESPETWNR